MALTQAKIKLAFFIIIILVVCVLTANWYELSFYRSPTKEHPHRFLDGALSGLTIGAGIIAGLFLYVFYKRLPVK